MALVRSFEALKLDVVKKVHRLVETTSSYYLQCNTISNHPGLLSSIMASTVGSKKSFRRDLNPHQSQWSQSLCGGGHHANNNADDTATAVLFTSYSMIV